MNSFKILSKLTIFSLLFIPYAVLTAEEEAAGGLMEEVVVTARKREETAQSLSLIHI